MKNTVIAIISVLIMFTSSGVFAKGMSLGLLGSYAIDGGAIEKTAEKSLPDYPKGKENIDFDPVEIAGAVFFLRYDFKNNIFLRTGLEINAMIKGGKLEYYYSDSAPDEISQNTKLEYEAYTLPLYLGITLSPDKGKTSVYGAAGIFFSEVSIERKTYYKYISVGTTEDDYHSRAESDSMIFGFCGLLGLERRIFQDFYFVIEYAIYSGEKTQKESGESEVQYLDTTYYGGTIMDYEYTERYGLPRQQIRIGLKYDF